MSPIIASAAMAGAATRRQRLSMVVPTPARRAGRREEHGEALYAYALLGVGTVLLLLGAVGAAGMH